MNKKQLQKLAGLLKEGKDFDLSDNPLQMNSQERQRLIRDIFEGLEQGDSVTILRDDIVKIFPKYAKKLEAFAKLEDDIYNAFEALYMGDDDLNEADDFDLSDNPAAIRYPKSITATIDRLSTTTHQGHALISGKHFEQWLDKAHDTNWQDIEENDEVEYYISLYAKEYDYSSHFDVDWDETNSDIEQYDIDNGYEAEY